MVSLSIGGQLPQAPLGPRGADFPVVTRTESVDTTTNNKGSSVPTPAYDQTAFDRADRQRYEAVVQASRNFFKDVYAVSDTSFTIYKDMSGQYVTRYTSLRDGRVTYVPEQNILQYAQSQVLGGQSFIQIRV